MSDERHIARLKISEINHNNDGTSTVNFELTEDFVEWFNQKEGDVDFSHEKFSKFISEVIRSNLNDDSPAIIGKITSE